MAKAEKFSYKAAPGRLIILPLERSEKTDSGIYLPESAKERPQLGKVIAYSVGFNDQGKQREPVCVVGDTVFHSKYGGTEVKIGGTEYLILREDDVLAIQA
jgi:chaperonin GroES